MSSHAHAAPGAAERETARSLMVEGDRLSAAGDFRGALARYQSAHAIMHVPTTGWGVARTYAQLGQLVEARAVAIEVINLPLAPDEPVVFADARRSAAGLASELEPRVPSLRTVVSPPDAAYTLRVDGVTLPAEARQVPFRTNPGLHSVRVEAPGFAPEVREVTLAEATQQTLSISLRPALAAEAPPPPSAAAVAATQSGAPDVDPAQPGRVRGIVGLSVGGAVLIAGSVAGILSLTQTNEQEQHCVDGNCPVSSADELDSANMLANVANICIPLGALGIAYGLYELLSLPKTKGVSVAFTGTGAQLRGAL